MGRMGCERKKHLLSDPAELGEWTPTEAENVRRVRVSENPVAAEPTLSGWTGSVSRRSGELQEKKELNSEMWGKGVCDIWEKLVSGWRNRRLCSKTRIKFWDMGKMGVQYMGEMGVWVEK